MSTLPKDMQVSAQQKVNMKADWKDEHDREKVLKDIIGKVMTFVHEEIAGNTSTCLPGVTVEQVLEQCYREEAHNWGEEHCEQRGCDIDAITHME